MQFHFSMDGGIDTGPHGDGVGGGYLFCDGDNRAGDDPSGKPRLPVMYTSQQIAPAQPIAYVMVTAAPVAPLVQPPAMVDWQAKYEALVANMETLIKTA